MKREQFISFCFIALLVFIIWQIFLIFSPFFRAIFWASILAFAFHPIYRRLRTSLKMNETLAALLMTILIFLIVLPPVILLVLNLTSQAIELYQSASAYIQGGGLEQLIEKIRSLSFIEKLEAGILQWDPLKRNLTDWILGSSRAIGNFAASQAGIITKNLFFIALNIFLMSFLIFIFLKDGERIYRFIYQMAPLEERNKKPLFRQINETFSAVIRGQLLTSMTQAATAGVFFWILGIPLPIFFAAATFLTSIIPFLGASSIWVPLVAYLAVNHEYGRAMVLLVLGTLVISLIDNLMKPALIGERTKLPYFLLFFGILGGIKVYGLMGIFLAPAILSLFFAVAKIYQEEFLDRTP